MIDAMQCRAARGLLDWTVPTLAARSNISASTIFGFEGQLRRPTRANLEALQRAFELAGVELISGNNRGQGVRMQVSKAQLAAPRFPSKQSFEKNFKVDAIYNDRSFTICMPVGVLQRLSSNAPNDPFDEAGLEVAFQEIKPAFELAATAAIKNNRADPSSIVLLSEADIEGVLVPSGSGAR
jgi:transcriptional regulator with XRE-family HTH domain